MHKFHFSSVEIFHCFRIADYYLKNIQRVWVKISERVEREKYVETFAIVNHFQSYNLDIILCAARAIWLRERENWKIKINSECAMNTTAFYGKCHSWVLLKSEWRRGRRSKNNELFKHEANKKKRIFFSKVIKKQLKIFALNFCYYFHSGFSFKIEFSR